jgi:hypothetical protein
MTSRFSTWIVAILALAPALVHAEEPITTDARLVGYNPNVALEGGSTASMWLLLIGLAIVCMAPLFMNARRTHLD